MLWGVEIAHTGRVWGACERELVFPMWEREPVLSSQYHRAHIASVMCKCCA